MSEVEMRARELFRATCLKGELEPTEERWERGRERFTKQAQYAIALETKRSAEETRAATLALFIDDLNQLVKTYDAEILAGYNCGLIVQFIEGGDEWDWEHYLEFDSDTREYRKP